MNELDQNRALIIGGIVIGIIVLGIFFLGKKDAPKENTGKTPEEQVVETSTTTNATEQKTEASKTTPAVKTYSPNTTALRIGYPNGGEVMGTSENIRITYTIDETFKKRLTSREVVELYLVNDTGTLLGFIGKVDPSQTAFVWNQEELFHNEGTVLAMKPAPRGAHRILVVARTSTQTDIDTLDNALVTYSNGIIRNKGVAITTVLATDISNGSFTLR